MPIYEYRCQKCAHEYEKREGFDAPARQKCPKCRGRAQRVLHAAPIVFKGSGFYVTDNRKNGAGAEKESKPSSETSSDSSSDKKDAKPPSGADSTSAKTAAS